ncbi:MAG: lipB [Chthoniobacteraceae bacterium]|nr:lipB [Chthoniobacteraceae bacterium]
MNDDLRASNATAPGKPIQIRWFGRVGYEQALQLQEELVAGRIDGSSEHDALLLLEHDPVYTIGRTPDQSSLRKPEELPYPLVQISRGGQATYHGPGQLVGYPILDLRPRGQDLHRYMRALEETLIETLRSFQIAGIRREGLTGVWVGPRKIASIGVGVRRWISLHGFALNVCGDLAPFTHITPCGIAGVEMTNMEIESGRDIGVQEVAHRAGEFFRARFE